MRAIVKVLTALELQRMLPAEALGRYSRDESVLSCRACVLITTEADYWCTNTLGDKWLFSPGLWKKMTSLSSRLEQVRICYGIFVR